MKKINSKLFSKFQLKNDTCAAIVGGLYTSADNDTTTTSGYDVRYDTMESNGECTEDSANCHPGSTVDKPIIIKA